MPIKFPVAFLALLAVNGVLGTIGTVPRSTTTVQRSQSAGGGTSYSGVVSGSGSLTPARQGSATSMADPATIENAVVMYNALVAVIRDVLTRARLTPIGGTEGVVYVQSCAEHKAKRTKGAETKTGTYVIWPTGKVLDGSKQVICDMDTDHGGWTVIQRRGYGTVARDKAENFNRNWREYKTGFGTPVGDYWIGLDSMHTMGTSCSNELMVTLTYFDDTTKTATYSNFTVGPESDNYRLHIAGFTTGAAEDVFEKKHNGLIFNTHDKDNEDKCGAETKSGWWFVSKKSKNWCAYVDLNAELKDKATDTGGMTWRYSTLLKGWNNAPAIKKAEMKIKPKCPPS